MREDNGTLQFLRLYSLFLGSCDMSREGVMVLGRDYIYREYIPSRE